MTAASYRLLVVVLGMFVAIGPLCIDMYLPSMPTIQGEFGASPALTQLTLSSFLIGYSLGQLLYGPISDRYGRKPVMLVGISAFTLASLGCALAPDINALILMRFLQAVGGGAGVVLARAIVRDYFPVTETARLLSLISVITLVAPLISPIMGGYILVLAGWRAVFWVLALLGVVYILMILKIISESLPVERRQHMNFANTALAYRRILLHRQSFGYIASSTLSATAIFAYIASAPFVFIEVYGIRPDNFGYLYGTVTSGLIVCAILNSRLVVGKGLDTMIIYGHIMRMTGVVVLLFFSLSGVGGIAGIVFALILCVSPTIVININAATGLLGVFPEYAGTASSISGAAIFFGGALSSPIVGLLHDGTVMPMTIAVTLFSIASLIIYWVMVIIPGSPVTEPDAR